jgi:hypothetical protein
MPDMRLTYLQILAIHSCCAYNKTIFSSSIIQEDFMDNSPHKTWITPQIFVLGAEGTMAYQAGGTLEQANHQSGLWIHNTASGFTQIKPDSTNTYSGYQS